MGEVLEGIDARDAARLTTRPGLRCAGSRRRGWPRRPRSLVALAALVVGSFVRSPRPPALTEQDTIVLADFENTTGEPVFDGALKVALAVALEQSPFLKVFPDERARETLRLMQRSPDERVTRAIAREIARREQLKALLVGSIASLGRNYVLALEAINAETGDVMAREQAEAGEQGTGADVARHGDLDGCARSWASRWRRFRSSTSPCRERPPPRSRRCTPTRSRSRRAAWFRGSRRSRTSSARSSSTRTSRWRTRFCRPSTPTPASRRWRRHLPRKAFELRDRVSERERFFISWRYYRDAEQAWDKALELARSWTTTYPREAFAFNSLGSALIRLGQYEQSVEPFREAIRLDPRFVPPYGNLGASLMALNRFDESKAVLQQAFDQGLDFIGAHRISYLLAFVQGDPVAMAQHLEPSVGVRQTNQAFGWQASTSAFAGRMQAAHEQFRRGVQMSLQGEFKEVAAQLTMRGRRDSRDRRRVRPRCAKRSPRASS